MIDEKLNLIEDRWNYNPSIFIKKNTTKLMLPLWWQGMLLMDEQWFIKERGRTDKGVKARIMA